MIKIDCIADLHGHYPKLEGGDLLIVAGDLTASDTQAQYLIFREWLRAQEYKQKIFICGNHDRCIEQGLFYFNEDWMGAKWLNDSGTEFSYHIDGLPEEDEGFLPSGKRTLKIWGSPWTKRFEGMNLNAMAFTVDTEEELAEKWKLIPAGTDILITHSPPFGIKDKTVDGEFVGSETLAYYVGGMKPPPKLWVWGHIHESYGRDMAIRGANCIMVNASHVNERYEPVNKSIRVEL